MGGVHTSCEICMEKIKWLALTCTINDHSAWVCFGSCFFSELELHNILRNPESDDNLFRFIILNVAYSRLYYVFNLVAVTNLIFSSRKDLIYFIHAQQYHDLYDLYDVF